MILQVEGAALSSVFQGLELQGLKPRVLGSLGSTAEGLADEV